MRRLVRGRLALVSVRGDRVPPLVERQLVAVAAQAFM